MKSPTQKAAAPKTCLLVLGMHRSGTSALSRLLNLRGATLPRVLIDTKLGNKTGHWEPLHIVEFNDHLLSSVQSAWNDWAAPELTRLPPKQRESIGRDLANLLTNEIGDADMSVLKDPRMCRFVGLYAEAFDKIGVRMLPIIMFRNPFEVIQSLRKRSSNWPEGHLDANAALLWLAHFLEAEVATRGQPRAFLAYDALLTNWRASLDRIERQLNLTLPVSADEAGPQIDAFLSPSLRHNNAHSVNIASQPLLRGWCSEAFDAASLLVTVPNSKTAMRILDGIRKELFRSGPVLEDVTTAANAALVSAAEGRRRNLDEIERLANIITRQSNHNDALDAQLAQRDHKVLEQNRQLQGHKARIDQLQQEYTRSRDDARRYGKEVERLDKLLEKTRNDFLASMSWRVTAPLRAAGTLGRWLTAATHLTGASICANGGLLRSLLKATRIALTEGPRGMRRRLSQLQPLQGHRAPRGSDPLQCLIVTTPHVTSVAALMKNVLEEEGFRVTISQSIVKPDLYGHVFVLCPQMFDNLPDHYVAFQMEQHVSPRWFTPEYFEKLRRARAVIDYSEQNIEFLVNNALDTWKLFFVPIDTDPRLVSMPSPEEVAARKGILFYGDDKCERRQIILQRLKNEFPDLRIVSDGFGDKLHEEMQRAAVVVNIHYYENALLESTRIFEALSRGVPVVSEKSVDQDAYAHLDPIVDFVDIGDVDALVVALRRITEDDAARAKRMADIGAFAKRSDNRFADYFRRFLLAQKMIGYDAFALRAPDYPTDPGVNPRLCLSLPETAIRRRFFKGQGHDDFTIWDGLRATPGWVGAAMSYMHLFSRLRSQKVQKAIVCEDDAIFPADFDQRLSSIERYLDQRDWDLFSGLLADVHDDMKILDVEEFEGETFVVVDKAVSMVCNIYNKSMIDFLADWDPTDTDVHRNTIDRYLERRAGCTIILTVPFLVGHRSEAVSTVWGFNNTQYDAMIESSERILTEKVAAFRQSVNIVEKV